MNSLQPRKDNQMDGMDKDIEDNALRLYREPAVGSSNSNSYGEENIQSLVNLYRGLDEKGMRQMMEMFADFSKSANISIIWRIPFSSRVQTEGRLYQPRKWILLFPAPGNTRALY